MYFIFSKTIFTIYRWLLQPLPVFPYSLFLLIHARKSQRHRPFYLFQTTQHGISYHMRFLSICKHRLNGFYALLIYFLYNIAISSKYFYFLSFSWLFEFLEVTMYGYCLQKQPFLVEIRLFWEYQTQTSLSCYSQGRNTLPLLVWKLTSHVYQDPIIKVSNYFLQYIHTGASICSIIESSMCYKGEKL